MEVTQDTLYNYLQSHDVKMIRLSEMIGCSDDTLTACFQHRKDRHGQPRRFSDDFVVKINEALPRLSSELRSCILTFGTPYTRTNKHGRTYDPGQLEPIRNLGRYLNITGLTARVLGWSKCKKSLVLVNTSSAAYGNISEADIIAINEEILSISAVLSDYKVIQNKANEKS